MDKKPFETTIETPIFESSFQKIRVSLVSMFTKEAREGQDRSASYYHRNNGNFVALSSVYTVFEYFDKDEYKNTRTLYIPPIYMFDLKRSLTTIKDMLNDPNNWSINQNGQVESVVKHDVVGFEMSKGKWLGFTLAINVNESTNQRTKGVQVHLSYENTYILLRENDFLHIYQSLIDVSLVNVQLQHMILKGMESDGAFVNRKANGGYSKQSNYQPQKSYPSNNNYQQNSYNRVPNQPIQQEQQNFNQSQPQQQFAKPKSFVGQQPLQPRGMQPQQQNIVHDGSNDNSFLSAMGGLEPVNVESFSAQDELDAFLNDN